MKIIYVTESFPFGHGEAFLIPELKELLMLNNELLIIPMHPAKTIIHEDAKLFLPNTLSSPRFTIRFIINIFKFLLINPFKTCLIFTWLLKSRTIKIFLRNLRIYPKGFWLAGISKWWKAEHIHSNFAVSSASAAMLASNLSGIPWSFTAHRYDIVENDLFDLKIKTTSFSRFISNSGVALAQSMEIRLEPDKTLILHMGVELPIVNNDFQVKEKKTPILFCPANLIPVKGHKYLLHALAILKDNNTDVCLWIAGDGPLYNELKKQAESLNISVKFLGQISHSALLNLYKNREVDIVILPSIDLGNGLHEGIPVSLMEAMSYGTPVISTMTGGIPELLKDGAGLLVEQKDSKALADAITRLINSPDLVNQLKINGRNRIERYFNAKISSKKLLKNFISARKL